MALPSRSLSFPVFESLILRTVEPAAMSSATVGLASAIAGALSLILVTLIVTVPVVAITPSVA